MGLFWVFCLVEVFRVVVIIIVIFWLGIIYFDVDMDLGNIGEETICF